MSKQTAVDFFHDEVNKLLPKKIITTNDIGLIWVKAKEMERQQIIDAYHKNPKEAKWKNIGVNYYNETYRGQDE